MRGETEAFGQQEELPDHAQLRTHTWAVNLSDPLFWAVLFMFAFEPMHRCVIAYQEHFRSTIIRFLGTNLTFRIYCIMSFGYSFLMFFLFLKAVNEQPRLRDLQRNEALMVGYVFALTGFCIKARVHRNSPLASIMGGQYFGIKVHRKKNYLDTRDHLYHPLGTASVVCYFGFSIIRASAAGILITITLGLSTFLASHLERYFLSRGTKKKLQQPGFTSVARSQDAGNRTSSEVARLHDGGNRSSSEVAKSQDGGNRTSSEAARSQDGSNRTLSDMPD
ncbi:hypothetical protein BsWGS_16656 [Bradybaena similaris]